MVDQSKVLPSQRIISSSVGAALVSLFSKLYLSLFSSLIFKTKNIFRLLVLVNLVSHIFYDILNLNFQRQFQT